MDGLVAIVEIGGRKIGPGEPCYIIAEAGVNHNGDLELAKRLIDVAVEAEADAVKFQTFKAELVAIPNAPKAGYQLETTKVEESQLEMIKGFELPPEAFGELQTYCTQRGITFLSTPYDHDSVDILCDLGVPAIKVASAEIVNHPLLRHIARKGLPVILSTGMSYLSEVEASLRAIAESGNPQVVLLHCVSNYPAPPSEINLAAMSTLAQSFGFPVGFSDHTPGTEVALAAVVMGACVIEKHFTLDKQMPGPDHRASLEPDGLARLVEGIRTVESAVGDGIKVPKESEQGNIGTMRRSMYLQRSLDSGAVIKEEDLIALRPAYGISPAQIDLIVGLKLRRPLSAGSVLAWSDLE